MHEVHKDTVAISIQKGVLPEIVDLFGLSEEKSSEDEQDIESLIEEVQELLKAFRWTKSKRRPQLKSNPVMMKMT